MITKEQFERCFSPWLAALCGRIAYSNVDTAETAWELKREWNRLMNLMTPATCGERDRRVQQEESLTKRMAEYLATVPLAVLLAL